MLAQLALIPDVFDVQASGQPEVHRFALGILKDYLLEEGVVRDLRNGEWSQQFQQPSHRLHVVAKEFIETLAKQSRLCRMPTAQPNAPRGELEDAEWYYEALASHEQIPLVGIVAGDPAAWGGTEDPLLTRLDRLQESSWWKSRSCSCRLRRDTNDYLNCLKQILHHANSVTFIDPYIDLQKRYDGKASRYEGFGKLVLAASRRDVQPRITIHCMIGKLKLGDNSTRQHNLAESQKRFDALIPQLIHANSTVNVFVWDNFHDRYLLTNQIGISMPNGFDIAKYEEWTTWTRVSRTDKENVEGEFDPNSHRHNEMFSFKVSGTGFSDHIR
jgi:hypothetical protein